jgi:hypothetical protein
MWARVVAPLDVALRPTGDYERPVRTAGVHMLSGDVRRID